MDAQANSVLVIDDEIDMADMLELFLRGRGYSVSTANTGERALGLVQERDFDVVICDLLMPGWGGIETVQALKQVRPGLKVIVATGYLSDKARAAFASQGVEHFLRKPFTTDELSHVIGSALNGDPAA